MKKKIDFHNLNKVIRKYDLATPNRKREVVYRRHLFCSVLVEAGLTLGAVGKLIDRGHATVIHSRNKHEILSMYDDYNEMVRDIKTDLSLCFYTPVTDEDLDINTKEMISLVLLENNFRSYETV